MFWRVHQRENVFQVLKPLNIMKKVIVDLGYIQFLKHCLLYVRNKCRFTLRNDLDIVSLFGILPADTLQMQALYRQVLPSLPTGVGSAPFLRQSFCIGNKIDNWLINIMWGRNICFLTIGFSKSIFYSCFCLKCP